MGIVYGIATKIKNNGWLRGIIERNFARYCITGRLFYHLEDFTFSQNFEDAILERLIREYHILSSGVGTGVYVDIGAHHPVRFSNTHRFWLQGWHGINVDPLPHVMELFQQERPNDVNLNVGISDADGSMTYYSFQEPAYNTMDDDVAKERLKQQVSPLIEKISVPVVTLQHVLDRYLPDDPSIDIMDIDVEGFEMNVVRSFDWEKYRPKVFVMESYVGNSRDIRSVYDDEAVGYVLKQEYSVVAHAFNAVFLMDKRIRVS